MAPRFPEPSRVQPESPLSATFSHPSAPGMSGSKLVRLDDMDSRFNYFAITEHQSASLQAKVRFYYIDSRKWGIVWTNVAMFFFLHIAYVYGVYHLFAAKLWYTWMFGKFKFKFKFNPQLITSFIYPSILTALLYIYKLYIKKRIKSNQVTGMAFWV